MFVCRFVNDTRKHFHYEKRTLKKQIANSYNEIDYRPSTSTQKKIFQLIYQWVSYNFIVFSRAIYLRSELNLPTAPRPHPLSLLSLYALTMEGVNYTYNWCVCFRGGVDRSDKKNCGSEARKRERDKEKKLRNRYCAHIEHFRSLEILFVIWNQNENKK